MGGLADTIFDAGSIGDPVPGATGFLFDGETAQDMVVAVGRALAMFALPQLWRALQCQDMTIEAGWEQSSQRYIALYRALISESAQAMFVPVSRETGFHLSHVS